MIELAIAIVIVSLLAGAGLYALNSQMESQRVRTTEQRMAELKDALRMFLARQGRLPCPAVATLAAGAAGYGVEAAIDTSASPHRCAGVIVAGASYKGVLPWVTLGMTTTQASDGWGRRFTYQVSRNALFIGVGNSLRAGTTETGDIRGNLTMHSALPAGIGLYDGTANAAGNQINGCVASSADANKCNNFAVAVLISHGKNGLGAWQENGVRMALPASGAQEERNTQNGTAFLNVALYESDTAAHFDDVVLGIAPRDLLDSLVASSQVTAERALMNQRIDAMKSAILAYAMTNKSGSGAGSEFKLPVDQDELHDFIDDASAHPRDIWGAELLYEKEATADKVKIDTTGKQFTIKTLGPNGIAGPNSPDPNADDETTDVYAPELIGVLLKNGAFN